MELEIGSFQTDLHIDVFGQKRPDFAMAEAPSRTQGNFFDHLTGLSVVKQYKLSRLFRSALYNLSGT